MVRLAFAPASPDRAHLSRHATLSRMGAVKRDLRVEQGVSWSAAWHVKLDGVDLDPADGWQARSQVRAKVADPVILHQFAVSIVGPVVQLSVAPEVSSAWSWRRGVYDVEIFNSASPPRVVRIVEGAISVVPEVTR